MWDDQQKSEGATDPASQQADPYATVDPAPGWGDNGGGGGDIGVSAPVTDSNGNPVSPSGGAAFSGPQPGADLAVQTEAPSRGLGAWKWLIWIGVLILINVLSYAFDWPFWVY